MSENPDVSVLIFRPEEWFSTKTFPLSDFRELVSSCHTHEEIAYIHLVDGKLQISSNFKEPVYVATLDFLPQAEKDYLQDLIKRSGALGVILSGTGFFPCDIEGNGMLVDPDTDELVVVTDPDLIEEWDEDGAYLSYYPGETFVLQRAEVVDGVQPTYDPEACHVLMLGSMILSLRTEEQPEFFPDTLLNYFKDHLFIVKY